MQEKGIIDIDKIDINTYLCVLHIHIHTCLCVSKKKKEADYGKKIKNGHLQDEEENKK